jgi:hypothetical protein
LIPLTHIHSSHEWDDGLVHGLYPRVRIGLGDHSLATRTMNLVSELIDNATTHGNGEVGTFVCVQRYTGNISGLPGGIWIAVADGGVGIPDHLRRNPQYAAVASDSELIRLARQPRVTGTPEPRGWGLVEVFDDAAESGPSDLMIRSARGEGSFRLRKGHRVIAAYGPLPRHLPGTWIHVRTGG